jgi:hypothetical protein
LAFTDTVTECTEGSVRIISASASVMAGFPSQGGRRVPSLTNWICVWSNRSTMKFSGPSVSSSPVTEERIPVMIAPIATTAATPITMPRIVSAARTLLERSASHAMPTPSRVDWSRIASLFIAKRLDRVQA